MYSTLFEMVHACTYLSISYTVQYICPEITLLLSLKFRCLELFYVSSIIFLVFINFAQCLHKILESIGYITTRFCQMVIQFQL